MADKLLPNDSKTSHSCLLVSSEASTRPLAHARISRAGLQAAHYNSGESVKGMGGGVPRRPGHRGVPAGSDPAGHLRVRRTGLLDLLGPAYGGPGSGCST
jgi:hypothetical protein